MKYIKCIGCRASVPDTDGPVHKYIISSPGCWKIYGEVLAKEYTLENYDSNIHRITVDTFAISHPGKSERRAIQSVNIHLVSIYLVLKENFSGEKATEVLRKLVENKDTTKILQWLDPPLFNDTLHLTDVLKANDFPTHKRLVLKWGKSVLNVWEEKHLDSTKLLIDKL